MLETGSERPSQFWYSDMWFITLSRPEFPEISPFYRVNIGFVAPTTSGPDYSIITASLKYPAAVGEARMLQLPHDGASLGVEPPRPGSEFTLATLS